jgi:tRNA(Ile)-lysidine synthase
LPFLTNSKQPAVLPESEARLRKLRWTHLRQWQREQSGIVATGHHAQDFLETRLINLIRGTGPHGLHSMNLYDPDRLLVRPLLNVTAEEIASYSQALDVLFLNDPTNHDLSPLRNWLRHSWLPALDKKRPGSIQSFARSLDLMAQSQLFQEGAGLELDRRGFKRVADATKSLLVVELFRRNGVRSYTKAHVGEFLKRLDTTRKNFRFSVAGFEWIADAERVKRLSSESG